MYTKARDILRNWTTAEMQWKNVESLRRELDSLNFLFKSHGLFAERERVPLNNVSHWTVSLKAEPECGSVRFFLGDDYIGRDLTEPPVLSWSLVARPPPHRAWVETSVGAPIPVTFMDGHGWTNKDGENLVDHLVGLIEAVSTVPLDEARLKSFGATLNLWKVPA